MISNYPLVKFTIIFITGIIFSSIIRIDLLVQILLLSAIIITTIIFFILNKDSSQLAVSILTVVTIFLIGSSYFSVRSTVQNKYPFKLPKQKDAVIYGSVDKIELIKEGRLSFKILTDSIIISEKKYGNEFQILCSIYDQQDKLDSLYDKVSVGNSVVCKSTIHKPRDKRNPFEFDFEKYLNEREIVALATSYSSADISINDNNVDVFRNAIFGIRKQLDEKLSLIHNKTTSSMLRGLLLADRSGIDSEINQDFINSGVVHVLSVSGLHVGYIVIIFLFLFSRMPLYWRTFLTILGLFLYMIITGSEAPVFRCTIMASVILTVPLFGRMSNSINTLSLAALVILILSPKELFNPSFQLSFTAILSLIILYPPLKKFIDQFHLKSKALNYFLMFIGSTIAVQVGTMPFILVYFGKISITSLFANAFVIPISGLLVGIGIVSLFLSPLSLFISGAFASMNELLTYSMLNIVRLFGNPHYSFISIRQFSLYDGILFYLSFAFLFTLWKYFNSAKAKIIFIVLITFLFLTYKGIDDYELMPEGKLSVLMIDVGQGDSFLIKFPEGKTALIDGGNATVKFDNGKRIITPLLDKLGIPKLDYVFISHIDDDHYRGVISLINDNRVNCVYKPTLDNNQEKDVRFEKFLKRTGTSLKEYIDKTLSVGNTRLYFLNNRGKQNNSINDRSGIIKLVYGNSSILFTGDAGIKRERELIKKYQNFLNSDILKAGHHGSKTSSSKDFLDKVNPKITLISAGVMNKFKHPSKEVIKEMYSRMINILRTDISGAVLLQLDGNSIHEVNWRRMEKNFINL